MSQVLRSPNLGGAPTSTEWNDNPLNTPFSPHPFAAPTETPERTTPPERAPTRRETPEEPNTPAQPTPFTPGEPKPRRNPGPAEEPFPMCDGQQS